MKQMACAWSPLMAIVGLYQPWCADRRTSGAAHVGTICASLSGSNVVLSFFGRFAAITAPDR